MKRSTYYHTLKSLQKEDKYKEIRKQIKEIFEISDQTLGYRSITLHLKNKGYKINHKTVYKLMKEENLICRIKKKKYKHIKSKQQNIGEASPNKLNREFTAVKPYEKIALDITEVKIKNQRIYIFAVIDMYNGEIVAYDVSESSNLGQLKRIQEKLKEKIPKESKPLMHLDQGWQFRHRQYTEFIKEQNWTQSMSRKGNCYDNSIIENFFGIMKSEMYHGLEYANAKEFEDKLDNYIYYYNNIRIKHKLKMSPVEYRLQNS